MNLCRIWKQDGMLMKEKKKKQQNFTSVYHDEFKISSS